MKIGRFFSVLTVLLSGCMVGPHYIPPNPNVCDTWITPPPTGVCQSPVESPPICWWETFHDPLLSKYIEMAAVNNNDILTAEANIWQARALKQVAASALFPHIGADFNALRASFSKNGGIADLFAAETAPFEIPRPLSIYTAFIDATWEIDLFGKRRRGVEVAFANWGSAIEQLNQLRVSLFSEVALNYVQLRSLQNRGVLIEQNITLLEHYAAVLQKRFAAGYSNLLDLERVEAELAKEKAQLPDIYAEVYQTIYALSFLTGNVPEALLCDLLTIQPLPYANREVAIGIRSDLLRRRPDIRQAERQLAAATANIGVAVASFFPTFTLLGGIGLNSFRFSNLFEANSLAWAIDGNVSAPIYQGGGLTGNLIASQAQAQAALFQYRQTVLAALEEAEGVLIGYTQEIETALQLTEAVTKYEKLIFLTNERFTKGLINITDLLDIKRQWNSSEQSLLTSETAVLFGLIRLYKALGGGWQCS